MINLFIIRGSQVILFKQRFVKLTNVFHDNQLKLSQNTGSADCNKEVIKKQDYGPDY